jgi:hypothetical protein
MEQSSHLSVGSLYRVSWRDSGTHHADGWQTRQEILDEAQIEEVTSVGYVFQITPDAVYLGQTYDRERVHFFGTQVIQLSNIVEALPLYVGMP